MSVSCLVTGAAGQVGRALQEAVATHDFKATFFDKRSLDITQHDEVAGAIQSVAPNVVINAAAFTDVDGAEADPEKAFAVNRDGAGNLAKACKDIGIPLIHISTDFIFDGEEIKEYTETDPVSPLSVYGQSKAEGEAVIRDQLAEHLIIRTSWVFSPHGKNFVKSILRLAGEHDELRIVDDQIGGPTAARDIAEVLLQLAYRVTDGAASSDMPCDMPWGTYHYSGSPAVSRYDFATEIVNLIGGGQDTVASITPIGTSEYPMPARRPAHAVLDCSLIFEAFGIEQPNWRESLISVCRELEKK